MKKSIYWKIIAVTAIFSAILNLAAFSKDFCDIYTDKIYPFISDGIGKITDPISFSVGEYLMYLGIIILIVSVILLFALIFLYKREKIRRFCGIYYKSLLMAVSVLLAMYTVTWSVPVRGSLLGQNIPPSIEMDTEKIGIIRNYIVYELNRTAWEVPRDNENRLIFPSSEEIDSAVINGMRSLSEEYPRLSGFYPIYKKADCSDVLDWMGIGGFTMPFSMEISVNKYSMADRLFAPVLFAHESAHHQGYYKESEADYLAYIGCIHSENAIVRYSGLIYIFFEIEDAYCNSEQYGYTSQADIPLNSIIFEDITGEYENAAEAYQADEHPLESFQESAVEISDAGWEAQAAILKEYNYEGSTALLLRYFSKILQEDQDR